MTQNRLSRGCLSRVCCFISYLSLFLGSFWLTGQTQLHAFNHLGQEEGLSAGTNNHFIFRDRRDNVWISSLAGLNRFDGHRVTQYHQSDAPRGLTSEITGWSEFCEDRAGHIWFALEKSISRYDYATDSFATYTVQINNRPLTDHYDWAWVDTPGDYLYFGAGDYLFKTPTADFSKYAVLDSIKVNFKAKMVSLPGGKVRLLDFVPGEEAFRVVDYGKNDTATFRKSFSLPVGEVVNDVQWRRKDGLIVVSNKAVYSVGVNTSAWRAFTTLAADGFADPIEAEFREHTLLVATKNNGLFLFDLNKQLSMGPLHRVADGGTEVFKPKTARLTVDREGVIWVSTLNDGVFYTDPRAVKFDFLPPPDKESLPVVNLAQDSRERLLTLYHELYTLREEDETRSFPLAGLTNSFDEKTFLHEDAATGRLMIGSYDKLYVAEGIGEPPQALHAVADAPYRFGFGYNGLHPLPSGNFILSINDSLPVIANSTLDTLDTWIPTLRRPKEIITGENGKALYLTYSDTVHLIDVPAGRIDTSFSMLPSVTDAAYQHRGSTFYLATRNGLFVLSRRVGGWELRAENQVTKANFVSIEVDSSGRIWLAGSSGLIGYDPATNTQTTYTLADGLQGTEYIANASITGSDGRLYFGGSHGVNTFLPGHVSPSLPANHVRIVNTFVNGQKTEEESSFGHDQNRLKFQLACGEFADPKEVEYYYVLKGSANSDEQRVAGASIEFINLAPATYELIVWGFNSDGVRTSNTVKKSFTIRPPWHQTWLAYAAYTLTFLTLLGAILYFRYRQLRKVELAQLSTAEAERLAAETETSVLRLQMNPHFIFNSLNSIDDYIIDQNPVEAHDYLVVFAELMRDILDRSAQPLTRLDREVDLLSRYVAAERKRIGDGLRFVVDVDEALDDISTYLPTMILQPFVENAIWHGIGRRDGGGTVTLRFREAENMLVAEVEDDGRGRGNAGSDSKKQTSRALDITRKRLALLSSNYLASRQSMELASSQPATARNTPRYEIHDLKNDAGEATGTLVVLYLPLTYPDEDARRSN
ncbi:sensor histidine kinase [Neolewinella antarctica]|uniref:Ligand-binding sensor domain-containing protein n=1 Tax=Neolewinella antarctica TaxID=442734 RepID=A0ABX0XEI1_9BACT|nr:histidine kinase [Neolewinella antarctica]NJC27627.1 ligand-binding sensor domain-containing protein [Neolewinella antarctica]